MAHALTHYRRREYDKAITLLKRQAAHEAGDRLNFGRVLDLGFVYLAAGRYSQARKHFGELIAKTGYKVSDHYIYAGLSHWFQFQDDEALELWKEALKSDYSQDRGLDVRLLLYYAGVRKPGAIPPSFLEDEIASMPMFASDVFPDNMALYLCNQLCREAVVSHINNTYKQPMIRQFKMTYAEFYFSVKELERGNPAVFRAKMRQIADSDVRYGYLKEQLLARHELKRIRRMTNNGSEKKNNDYST